MGNRWTNTEAPRGEEYDERWGALAQGGASIHGEADCVAALAQEFSSPCRVLDAGCGTGRVAIELAARGFDVVGVDADRSMLDTARAKAPSMQWILADLALWDPSGAGAGFDIVVMAGNVMIFVAPGTEAAVLERVVAATAPGGLVIAGFQLRPDRLTLETYDACAEQAGLSLLARYGTWDQQPFDGGDYAVSVHRHGARSL